MKNYGTKNTSNDIATMSDVVGVCKIQEFSTRGTIDSDTDIVIYTGSVISDLRLPSSASNGHRLLVKNLGTGVNLSVVENVNSNIVDYNTNEKSNSVSIGKNATVFRFVKTSAFGDVWLVE